MKKNDQVNYCRRGYKDKVMTVAAVDAKAGTIDIADDEGVLVITACRFFENPAGEATLPDGYAAPLAAAEPDKRNRKLKSGDPAPAASISALSTEAESDESDPIEDALSGAD